MKSTFNKTKLATSLSLILGAATALPTVAFAAEAAADDIEVIQVTGMRSSLQKSVAVKRDSAGVVDAISAEDIGKFPDTNLAESLQRITGVSISRSNGEGSQVTVRGFGAGNNMVTLNGRTMPSANTFAGGGGSSRAFDFGNIASEGISSVEVYKTGKASIATGGIGASINVLTSKPLNTEGFNATVGAKAVIDTTNRAGDDVTPELSGLISYANDDATFGISLSASHQERDSGSTSATVNNWTIGYWDDVLNPQRLWNNADTEVINAPDQGQLYSRPNDLRYEFDDQQRTRDNAQLTLQFAPSDDFTATVDYTYAEVDVESHRGQITNWMQTGGRTEIIEFDNQTVATPVYIKETYSTGIDEGYAQDLRVNTNTLESIGVNLEYQVNDDLKVRFDAHDSEMHSRGTGPYGTGNLSMGLGNPTVYEREWNYGLEFPTYLNKYDDSLGGANNNNVVDIGDVSSTMFRMQNSSQKATVKEMKLDATYEFDNGKFDFGIETRDMESRTFNEQTGNIALGNWNAGNPGEFGDLVQPFDLPSEFSDFSPRSGGFGFIASPVELYEHALANPDPFYVNNLKEQMALANDNIVREETTALFAQVELAGELGDMPFSILTGLRYEETDVTSSSLNSAWKSTWEDNNDISITIDDTKPVTSVSAENEYNFLLPSLDISLNITDNLLGRFSFSKTIARAGLGNLGVSSSGFSASGGSTTLGTIPTASASNPGLLPLESSNIDVSLEWYYNEFSYASVGYFHKDVVNFIGSSQVTQEILDIRDASNGARSDAALAMLVEAGLPINDDNLYGQLVYNIHGQNDAAYIAEFGNEYTGTTEQNFFLANAQGFDIESDSTDRPYQFRTSTPDNGKDARIYGAEFAVQHFFGETGFGVQANYTVVRGNVGYDNNADFNTSQFALLGLSDTANLIGMYEKDGLQARISYNWRDEYLSNANQGGNGNPRYVEAYSQVDVNVSYEVTEDFTVFVEGLNVTEENSRSHGRNSAMMWDLFELGARYNVGARYNF